MSLPNLGSLPFLETSRTLTIRANTLDEKFILISHEVDSQVWNEGSYLLHEKGSTALQRQRASFGWP